MFLKRNANILIINLCVLYSISQEIVYEVVGGVIHKLELCWIFYQFATESIMMSKS